MAGIQHIEDVSMLWLPVEDTPSPGGLVGEHESISMLIQVVGPGHNARTTVWAGVELGKCVDPGSP